MLSDTIHERLKGWFARILLALIIVSFALFGVDAYFKGTGGGQWVAEVDGQKISSLEFDEALKREQARLRELGERDPGRLESPELRQRVLDELIRERVLFQAALARGYEVPEEALIAQLAAAPAFQENGRFSEQRFQAFLAQRRLSRAQFLQLLRQDVLANHVLDVAVASAMVPKTATEAVARALAEQREVSRALVPAEDFLASAKVEEAAVERYYQTHPELSRVPERVRVAYVVFSPDALLPTVELTEADLRAYYERHGAEFGEPEQRHVAHILIRVRPGASPAEREAAQKKASDLAQQAKADPARFAALARQFSEDPSTAERGGDLGSVTAGSLFPEVERVLAGMKPGEVSGPVSSPAGLHILLLKGVEPARSKPFEAVRDRVAEAARREAALRRFNEEAEKFGDLVYAQFASLEPAAAQYKLKVEQSGWLTRDGSASFPFDHQRLRAAIFSEEAVKQQRNTEAIEVAPNTLVAARVLEHQAAAQRPLAEVRGEIERILAREQAVKLAQQRGEALLARLRKGEDVSGLRFDGPRLLDRRGAQEWGAEAARIVFGTPAQPLPAYAGQSTPAGFVIYRITQVMRPAERMAQAQQAADALLQQAQASVLVKAYVDSLRGQAKIEIRKAALEKTER